MTLLKSYERRIASCWPAISSPFVPGQEVREKVLLFAHEMVNEETQEVAARNLFDRRLRREYVPEGAHDQDSPGLRS